jgi:hypothetical protein
MSWLAMRKVRPCIEKYPEDSIKAFYRGESVNGISEAEKIEKESTGIRSNLVFDLDLLCRLLAIWTPPPRHLELDQDSL